MSQSMLFLTRAPTCEDPQFARHSNVQLLSDLQGQDSGSGGHPLTSLSGCQTLMYIYIYVCMYVCIIAILECFCIYGLIDPVRRVQ